MGSTTNIYKFSRMLPILSDKKKQITPELSLSCPTLTDR